MYIRVFVYIKLKIIMKITSFTIITYKLLGIFDYGSHFDLVGSDLDLIVICKQHIE